MSLQARETHARERHGVPGPLAGKGGATQRGGGDAHGDKTGGSLTDEDRKEHARVDGRAHARDQNISPLRARGECQQRHDAVRAVQPLGRKLRVHAQDTSRT